MTKENKDAPIIAFKGFDEDFKCRGFQYEVGKSYEHEGDVSLCNSGFHACENPFDVWDYYPITSRFAKVEVSGEVKKDDKKLCAAKIEIKAELSLGDFIGECVSRLITLTKGKGNDPSGNSAQIGSSGNYARIDSSGDKAVIASAGDGARVKAKEGAWLSLAEFDDDGECIGFATGCIGKDGLKADTWYRAKGGKLVEDV